MKKAKEIWFLCRQYDARQALEMGLVNAVVPLADLERETVAWCREMLRMSPTALRLMKASFNAATDGIAGIQQLAHDANLLFYATEEAKEGREAFKAKRTPTSAGSRAGPDPARAGGPPAGQVSFGAPGFVGAPRYIRDHFIASDVEVVNSDRGFGRA